MRPQTILWPWLFKNHGHRHTQSIFFLFPLYFFFLSLFFPFFLFPISFPSFFLFPIFSCSLIFFLIPNLIQPALDQLSLCFFPFPLSFPNAMRAVPHPLCVHFVTKIVVSHPLFLFFLNLHFTLIFTVNFIIQSY